MSRLHSALLASFLAVASAPAALAVVPVPPDQIAFSGVLSSAGPVDLTARLYDAASGGTLIFKQSFPAVALLDGHFTVNLGPTGAATDSPANPLTTSLRTALTGDLAAGPGRFVEITVNTDPPLARVQLVLVPYAMRADHALTADVASNALDTQAVVGLDGGVLTELFEHYNEDGGPPASDPSEGTGDTDGDGEMNFVDPDNDDDALSDSAEGTLGTNINLVTPRVADVSPDTGSTSVSTPVTVNGTGFLPGLSADFGSQVFSPSGVSATSFQVTLAPEPDGTVLDLLVTNPNAESHLLLDVFSFSPPPQITNITPATGSSSASTLVTVDGIGFVPGLTAAFGSQVFSPSSVSPTSFQVTLAPEPAGTVVDLLVTNPNGGSQLLPDAFAFGGPIALPFALAAADKPVSIVARGGELLVYGTQTSSNRYAIDTLVDGVLAFNVNQPLSGTVPSAVGWSPSRVVYGLRGQAATLQVQLLRDNNGDRLLSASEAVALESPGAIPKTQSPSLAFDAAGRPGGGYVRNVGGVQTATAFHDRNGDGAFTGTNEVVSIEGVTGAIDDLGEASFDASGRLAYAYGVGGGMRLAWDRSGDGDFADTVSGVPELRTVTGGVGSCLGLAFDTAGRLAIVNGSSLFYDLTGDADFDDAGETTTLAGACDVTATSQGNRIAIAQLQGSQLHLLVDLSGDGDFAGALEDALLGVPVAQPIALTESANGAVRVLTSGGVILGPVR